LDAAFGFDSAFAAAAFLAGADFVLPAPELLAAFAAGLALAV
tara:strand:- start:33 stop:158 length:126 start_codon:yes stop_codon:yes gene_type:complete